MHSGGLEKSQAGIQVSGPHSCTDTYARVYTGRTPHSLDRNSRRGMAMLAVAEMCVSFTTRTGSALMMMSGISTLQMAKATTHWLAQR